MYSALNGTTQKGAITVIWRRLIGRVLHKEPGRRDGTNTASPPTASAIRRDRVVILIAIVLATVIAWSWLINMARDMTSAPMMGMPAMDPWALGNLISMVIMWVIMMVGMMLPSATPMILIYARVVRQKNTLSAARALTASFTVGYLVMWAAFSVVATLLQAALQDLDLISSMLESTSSVLGGALFIAAGVYQLTPLKRACLKGCRSPLDFVLHSWRKGRIGSLVMGLEHGVLCASCCWMMMMLLFVVGVMNLFWVAALTVLVLAEKALPAGEWTARIGGVSMLGAGIWLLSRSP